MYLVTGATGNVGRELVGQLLAGGQAVRVFVRDAERASAWRGRVDVAVGDFARPETFARALQGVRAVFVVNGGPDAATFERLMAAAVDAGRPRVVFLSSILAANPASRIGAMHRQKEDLVRAAGLEGTFLRCGAFMTNAYQWAGSIRAEGVVYNAMGEGRYAPIAPEDIAAVAVVAMTAEVPLGEILELTGAEMLTVPEQVRTLSKLLGRPLGCVDVPIEAAIQNLVRNGVPPRLAEAVGESFDAVRRGRVVRLTDTVASVTGREPLRF